MKKIVFLGVLSLILTRPLFAAYDEAVDLEKIVVTPARSDQEVADVPQAISVITGEQITASNARGVVDVLREEPGVVVRDYYGNGTKAEVDLRGFGETSPSNVLVLVDGRRVNEIDISGADWTQIPLNQIERIEILRGTGSVLYGDNATSGVINIITKTGRGKPQVSVFAGGGSYHSRKNDLDVSGSKKDLGYYFRMSDYSTAGYRQNSFYHNRDFSTKLNYEFNPRLQMVMSGGYHEADFGLPGFLTEANLNSTYSRRDSRFPDDTVGETDGYADFEIKHTLLEGNIFSTAVSLRERRVDDRLLSSGFVDNRKNDTLSIRPKYSFQKEFLGFKNNLVTGWDFYSVNGIIDEYGTDGAVKTRDTDIDRLSSAFYIQDEFNLTPKILTEIGYRADHARTSFNSTPLPGDMSGVFVKELIKAEEEAMKMAINYHYLPDSKVFISFAKGYRLPTTDEYFSVWSTPPVNANLLPQTSRDYECGINHSFSKKFKMEATVFQLDLKNELYYDPSTFTNNNYTDMTRRQGIEYGVEYYPWERLSLYGNYSFTHARFNGGSLDEKAVPGVATNKADVGFKLAITDNLGWQLSSYYVGKSYFISDFRNRASKLDGYLIFNTRLSFKHGSFSAFAGMNNVFNEKYSEYGVTNAAGTTKTFYPAPERNFVFGVKKEF